MEKHSQLELFSQIRKEGEAKKRPPGSFIYYMRNYEKTIIIIISLMITGIISFSLGVEKGKKQSNKNLNSRIDMAMKAQLPESNQIVTPEYKSTTEIKSPPTVLKEEVVKPKNDTSNQTYTIQVATYHTKTHAEKEAETLKKKGLSPSILSKGRYIVLYVGNFSNKETAKSALTELKKRYGDCFIRRL